MRRNVGVIINGDQRKVEDPNVFPYSAIGQFRLVWQVEGKPVYTRGTGTLIKQNVVLTCAHNIYSKTRGYIIRGESLFAPAINASDICQVGVQLESYWIPQNYEKIVNEKKDGATDPEAVRLDYGLIRLKQNIPLDNGVCEMTDPYALTPSNQNISISGYPRNKNSTMWTANGNIQFNSQSPEDVIRYRIDTDSGQSGSSLLTDNHKIVAVHSVGDDRGAQSSWYNEGVVLRSSIIEQIHEQIASWNAKITHT